MLVFLYIENFGLVDRLEMKFGPGLNVLTGETGAGKSILVEALKVSLGGRCQSDMIRTGRDRALVQSGFDLDNPGPVNSKLAEQGLAPAAGEDLLVLSRELHRQGRNICRVNGRVVNLSFFRELAALLVDMHGQHDHQSLLQPEKQLKLLDQFGGREMSAWLIKTGAAYRAWRDAVNRREKIVLGSRERQQRRDMLEYQVREIESAALAGEDESELYRRRDRLANAERIGSLLESVLQKIHTGSGQCPAAVDLLGEAKQELDDLCRFLPEGKSCLENVFSALCLVEDTARELAACRQNLETSPDELNYVEEKLATLEKLKRKYADTLEGIFAYRNSALEELEELSHVESDAAEVDNLVFDCEKEYRALADRVSRLRTETAGRLEKMIKKELRELEMPQVDFTVHITESQPSVFGIDNIQFLFSPNPGEPLRPLAKSASGGELSRVMLVIRSVLAAADETETLVFDEIDTGIGGRTIHAIAEKLEQLGAQRQVICITHAAAVAAGASTHFLVVKNAYPERTVTTVTPLAGELRIKEMNRMLGGDEDSELLSSYVRRMLK